MGRNRSGSPLGNHGGLMEGPGGYLRRISIGLCKANIRCLRSTNNENILLVNISIIHFIYSVRNFTFMNNTRFEHYGPPIPVQTLGKISGTYSSAPRTGLHPGIPPSVRERMPVRACFDDPPNRGFVMIRTSSSHHGQLPLPRPFGSGGRGL